MPAMFALGDKVIGNPLVATFAAFGSFAMVLLVDFAGPMRNRLQAQAALGVVCAVLICIATLVSRSTPLAAVAMALLAFAVLFAGVVSSVLAGATTALLLAFILPVSLPGGVSSIPDRVAGWGLAATVSLFAIALLWPAPVEDPLRRAAVAACKALGARLRADIAYALDRDSAAAQAERDSAVTHANRAVDGLQAVFFATPYRPSGLSTPARTVLRLVDEVRWLNTIVVQSAPRSHARSVDPRVWAVKSAVASVLESGAELLDHPGSSADALRAAQTQLRQQLSELERKANLELPIRVAGSAEVRPDPRASDIISALDPSFRAQELSFIVSQIAGNIDLAAAAARRSWLEQLLGHQPTGLGGTLSLVQERAGSHVERHSLWLRNSVRGAVALGLAVLVAKLTGVQHAFWVVLGTLSVLRSNALSTGQNVVRGLLGTLVGFIVGGALVLLVGTNTTLLWFLLPLAVLLAGLAPAAISFAAGQAAFTLTLLILFNILQPAGWRIGLVRIEDIVLGSGVSLVVGLLFWPRGAGATLGEALAEAYRDSASYLAGAVEFGIGCCDFGSPSPPAPTGEAVRAAAAARRLDDTFRGYLAERGAKPVPLAEVTSLVTGVVGLRLAGDAVLDLWQRDGSAVGDRGLAGAELRASSKLVASWYSDFATSLTGRGAVPEPAARDKSADSRLVDALALDLRSDEDHATATAARVIWTGDHLDAVRRIEDAIVGPARAAALERARNPLGRYLPL
jgi:uncharacterized membrane protein YccC